MTKNWKKQDKIQMKGLGNVAWLTRRPESDNKQYILTKLFSL